MYTLAQMARYPNPRRLVQYMVRIRFWGIANASRPRALVGCYYGGAGVSRVSDNKSGAHIP